MRPQLPVYIAILLSCAAGATGAGAQLVSERVEGLSRICTYAGPASVLTGGELRRHRVGIGQNCPLAFPPPEMSAQPTPPTAELQSETIAQGLRTCVYEEAGANWSFNLPLTQTCPLHAGLIEQIRNAGRMGPPAGTSGQLPPAGQDVPPSGG